MAQDRKTQQNEKNGQLEGEGSYTATRKYNQHLAEHQRTEDVERLAEDAREALEGEEGGELRQAEEKAKQGPGQTPGQSGRKSQ
jgi:hypothetical protein